MANFTVSGSVARFPQAGGWYYVPVSTKISSELQVFADRGLIPIKISLGDQEWSSSLLPMGDGTHFISLPAKVRKAEAIAVGAKVQIEFELDMKRINK